MIPGTVVPWNTIALGATLHSVELRNQGQSAYGAATIALVRIRGNLNCVCASFVVISFSLNMVGLQRLDVVVV